MVNPLRTGLVFGVFVALMHAGWSALVALRLAQPLIDFIFRVHFLTPILQVEAFDGVRAALLVGVTFAVAFAAGILAAGLWNFFHPAGQRV
jgi:hypothetical protein